MRHRGYSLIESMVAVVVIAVGFIGAARMQTLSLGMNNSSVNRTKAVLLVSAMEDRVRANIDGYNNGYYSAMTSGSATDPGCTSSTCTSAQMATSDYANWLADIQTGAYKLPSGVGYVCLSSSPTSNAGTSDCNSGSTIPSQGGPALSVKVCWTEKAPMGTQCFFSPFRP